MSNLGKTLLRGHTLIGEGRVRFESDGITESRDWSGAGMCSCGEMSEAAMSVNAVKRWHREHKDSLR